MDGAEWFDSTPSLGGSMALQSNEYLAARAEMTRLRLQLETLEEVQQATHEDAVRWRGLYKRERRKSMFFIALFLITSIARSLWELGVFQGLQ